MQRFRITCPSAPEDGSDCAVLESCVKSVKPITETGASSSTPWIVTFTDGTTAGGLPVEKAFMKWWHDISDLGENSHYFAWDSVLGLEYESLVYRDVIVPLIDSGTCPNFVRFLSGGTGCSMADMSALAKSDQKEAANAQTAADIEDNIKNRRHYEYSDPASWKFNFFMTQSIDDSRTLHNQMNSRAFNAPMSPTLAGVIFQVIAGCYAAALSQLTINDMHFGNIFLEEIPETLVTYNYAGISCTFSTTLRSLIFDFDRAYAVRLGDNESIVSTSSLCYISGQCNKYNPKKDLYKLFCSLYKFTNKSIQKLIIKVVAVKGREEKLAEFFKKSDDNCDNSDPEAGIMTDRVFTYMERPTIILQRWVEHTKLGVKGRQALDQNTYTCNPEMFEEDGSLK